MSISSAAVDLRGEVLRLEGRAGVKEAKRFDVWAIMAVRVTDDLDDVMENLYMHMITQLMKATASLHVSTAVKRSRDAGAASQIVMADRRPTRWLATQQQVESWRLLGASELLCRAIQFGILEQLFIPFSSGEVM
jgi:hypothetical protein